MDNRGPIRTASTFVFRSGDILASWGECQIPLGDFPTGGRYPLREPSNLDALVDLADGWHVELREGSRFVHAFASIEHDARQSVGAMHRALDVLAVEGRGFLGLSLRPEVTSSWSTTSGRRVLRLALSDRLVTGGSGTISGGIPYVPPPVEYHESFRYLRQAFATDDLFDSFRNLFLALELVLSSQLTKFSPENQWIRRAAELVDREVGIADILGCSEGVGDCFHNNVYAVRCQLFHAAQGRSRLEPGVPSDVEIVRTAWRVALRIYKRLAGSYYNVRAHGGGGLTRATWQRMASTLFESATVYMSGSHFIDPSHHVYMKDCDVTAMDTHYLGELSDGRHGLQAVLHREDGLPRSSLAVLIGDSSGLVSYYNFGETLDVEGFDSVEVQMVHLHMNDDPFEVRFPPE